MRGEVKRCPVCSAKMVEYKHTLSKGLVSALFKFYRKGFPLNVHKDLGLTTNQWDNFQKLGYWGIVQKCYGDNGKRLSGIWTITEKGIGFLHGNLIHSSVWTYRGAFVRFDGHLIGVDDVDPNYRIKEDYIADETPRRT